MAFGRTLMLRSIVPKSFKYRLNTRLITRMPLVAQQLNLCWQVVQGANFDIDKNKVSPLKPLKDPGIYGGRGFHFDPTPLESAVTLLREIPPGRAGLERAQQLINQEIKKIEECSHQRREFEALAKRIHQQAKNVRYEVSQAIRNLQRENDKKIVDFENNLKRKLESDASDYEKIEKQHEMNLKKQAAIREEQIRRGTLEYAAQLQQQTDMAVVKAQTEGGILAERQNHDIRMNELRQRRQEMKKTVMESIRLASTTIGSGLNEFFSNKEQMSATVALCSATALGIYASKTGIGVVGRYVESRLGRPSLIRESSRRNVTDFFKHPFNTIGTIILRQHTGDPLAGRGTKPKAVFDASLESRLKRIAQSAVNTRRNRAPFRHLLLHGPPGTGKTLFAKGLAYASGMDYAIMTGGDITPLGREAVTEIHKVFDWAQTSHRGVILFIDESDAFLRRRSTEIISEDMRNSLNAFLYRTGEQTDRFMIIYASNQPEQFDEAVNDRIDELISFPLPKLNERRRMIDFYFERYLSSKSAAAKKTLWSFLPWVAEPAVIEVAGIEEHHLNSVAEKIDGFSGREISKLVIAWQAAAFGNDKCRFTLELMEEIVDSFIEQKRTKEQWEREALIDFADGSPSFG